MDGDVSWITAANDFVSANQSLVVAIGVPTLTAMSAGIVSYFTTRMNLKSHREDRRLRLKMKAFELDSKKLQELRLNLIEWETVNFQFTLDIKQSLSARTEGDILAEYLKTSAYTFAKLLTEIEFQFPESDPDVHELRAAMNSDLARLRNLGKPEEEKNETRFRPLCKQLLLRMESDLQEKYLS